MQSSSSLIKEFLIDSYANSETPFTAKYLFEQVRLVHPSVTEGAVSGFLHKLLMAEFISVERAPGQRAGTYRVLKDLNQAIVSNRTTSGSSKGRHHRGGSPLVTAIIKEDILKKLLDAAADLENLNQPLDKYSSAELLAELQRRIPGKESSNG